MESTLDITLCKKRGGAVLVEEESVGVGDIDSESVGEFRGAASA